MLWLTRKKRVRGGHKGSATKLVNEVDNLLSTLDGRDLGEVSVKLAQLKRSLTEKKDAIETLDEEVVGLLEDEADLAQEIEEADAFKATVYRALTKIDRHENRGRPDSPSSDVGSHTSVVESVGSRAKLPKLTLRHFNGDMTQWSTFWDSFESAVHKNKSLSNIDKFNYLRSVLERSAKEAIAGFYTHQC